MQPLPKNLYQKIAHKLDLKDLISFCLVSKQNYEIVNNNNFIKTYFGPLSIIDENKFGMSKLALVIKVLKHCGRLYSLHNGTLKYYPNRNNSLSSNSTSS